jgi:drug/metabolite transporter (DMT)-like permease
MRPADVARLLALAVIWSASFVFIRVLAPVLGPVWVATARLLLGGAALVIAFIAMRRHLDVARHWRPYLLVGVLNSSLPFLLFAYAALTLPATYLVILNAALPLFAAVASAVWLGERLGAAKLAGLAAGAAGVILVSRAGPVVPDATFVLAVAASLGAVSCYALAGIWLKRRRASLPPLAVAGWSQLLGGVALLPLAAITPAPGEITFTVVVDVLLLALLCSAIAYVLYFRLIADVGPTRAMTVTFLMPAFGMLWGRLFLGETITLAMIAGAALIVGGTAAVLRPRQLRRRAVRATGMNAPGDR